MATLKVDQISTNLNTDIEVTAFSGLQGPPAVNQLIAHVNAFDRAIPPKVLAPADELIE